MYGGQASLGRACADLFQQARLNTDCKINFPGWVGVGVHPCLCTVLLTGDSEALHRGFVGKISWLPSGSEKLPRGVSGGFVYWG